MFSNTKYLKRWAKILKRSCAWLKLNVKIILKGDFKKHRGRDDVINLTQNMDAVIGNQRRSDKMLCFIRRGEFLDYMSNTV